MADSKISTLNSLTKSTAATTDVLPIVDTSATETKKITLQELLNPLDSLFRIADNSDTTKLVAFEVSGLTTGTTRTLTVPDADLTIVGTTTTQTLTNKTLTSPQINFGSDARGDLITRDSGGTTIRLAIGTTGQILSVSSAGDPEWIANPSAADASTTVKGVAEEATLAETLARTTAGGTSARLFVNPSNLTSVLTYDYAASSAGSDTYAITVTPAPTAYVTGQVFRFKADVANTGAATLNVNSLGAKSILRPNGSALADGDIAASQVLEVIYDGTQFLLLSPTAVSPKVAHGTTNRDLSTASGNQTIAHGLGCAPRFVRITAIVSAGVTVDSTMSISEGSYNGSTTATVYRGANSNNQAFSGTDTTNIIAVYATDITSTTAQVATVTVDATNITLAWTKNASPTSTAYIKWEAIA